MIAISLLTGSIALPNALHILLAPSSLSYLSDRIDNSIWVVFRRFFLFGFRLHLLIIVFNDLCLGHFKFIICLRCAVSISPWWIVDRLMDCVNRQRQRAREWACTCLGLIITSTSSGFLTSCFVSRYGVHVSAYFNLYVINDLFRFRQVLSQFHRIDY